MTDTTTPLPPVVDRDAWTAQVPSTASATPTGPESRSLISALATCALCCRVMAHRSRAIRAGARHTPPTYTGAVIQ
jgi:hypothetical protein